MIRNSFVLLLSSLLLMGGCSMSQDVKNAWKYTSKQYRTYLNTPASLDMEAKGDSEEYEVALGEAIYKVDHELQGMLRSLENTGRNIGPEWVMTTMRRFPWLSGVALVDGSGTLITRFPEEFSKDFQVGPLLEADKKQNMTFLRSYVQENPTGPEVYVGNPVYVNDELRGMVVAYFDPRALFATSSDPGRFVVASAAGVLWSGSYGDAIAPIAREDWGKTLKSQSSGIVGSGGNAFYWISRYIGNTPFVYAVPLNAKTLYSDVEHSNVYGAGMPSDAKPIRHRPGMMEGEVGNIGTPNVTPSPVLNTTPQESLAQPLEE